MFDIKIKTSYNSEKKEIAINSLNTAHDDLIEVDLHAHSFFSACGLHSIIEMLNQAKKKGIKAQAITDHGPYLGKTIPSTFFERLKNPVDGIILLKGMECNIIDEDGNIDVIKEYMPWYDLVLCGLHNFNSSNKTPRYYSEVIVKAIEKNPCIDIIVHPNASRYLTDFDMLTETAIKTNTVIELNNSKISHGRASREDTIRLIESCKTSGCSVAVNTDAHALNEIGNCNEVLALLKEIGFPKEKIINRSIDSALEWIKSRKLLKKMAYSVCDK